jgi:hypothetical protein
MEVFMIATPNEVKIVLKTLKKNGFNVIYAENIEQANQLMLKMIPLKAKVGIPGTTSIRQCGILDILKKRGNKIIDTSQAGSPEAHNKMKFQILRSDVMLASSNVVTLDGKLINMDRSGDRIAGMMIGPKKVILLVGTNKIVKDLDEGLVRLKQVIAPFHAMGRKKKKPCDKTGHCIDCNSSDRICNVIGIFEKKPSLMDFSIILVGTDLGLSWDPSWPKERIDKIYSTYRDTKKGYSVFLR